MSHSDRAHRRKEVSVVFFPKGGKPAKIRRTKTLTLPEYRPASVSGEEMVTEPNQMAPRDVSGERAVQPRSSAPRHADIRTLTGDGDPKNKGGYDLSQLGYQLFEAGRLHDARIIFEGLVATGAKDAFPYTMLGTIYLAMDEADRALALFNTALQVDPNDVAALVYRGEIRAQLNKTKPALADLERAMALGATDDPFVARARRVVRVLRSSGRGKARK